MDKVYIITAGCSFTDAHSYCDNNQSTWLDDFFIKENNSASRINYTHKYQNYLLYELVKKNIPFEYHNVAVGSSGNHIIKANYFKKVNELIEKGVDPKNIYATIQLTALYRPTNCAKFFKSVTDEWIYDYCESNIVDNIDDYKNLIKKHIQNIIEICNFNKNHNINHKLFWGWANLEESELFRFHLLEKYLSINNLMNFEYEEYVDDFFVNSNSNRLLKVVNGIFGRVYYTIKKGKFGGMLEMVNSVKKEDDQIYMFQWDFHLNSYGNYLFYKHFYRKIFEYWGIVDNNSIYDSNDLKIYMDRVRIVCNKMYLDSFGQQSLFQTNENFINDKNNEYKKILFNEEQ